MPEFEDIIKLIILVGTGGGLFIGGAFALKALRKPAEDGLLHERLADAEQRLADLEERADFAERVLGEVRDRPALPRE